MPPFDFLAEAAVAGAGGGKDVVPDPRHLFLQDVHALPGDAGGGCDVFYQVPAVHLMAVEDDLIVVPHSALIRLQLNIRRISNHDIESLLFMENFRKVDPDIHRN